MLKSPGFVFPVVTVTEQLVVALGYQTVLSTNRQLASLMSNVGLSNGSHSPLGSPYDPINTSDILPPNGGSFFFGS